MPFNSVFLFPQKIFLQNLLQKFLSISKTKSTSSTKEQMTASVQNVQKQQISLTWDGLLFGLDEGWC